MSLRSHEDQRVGAEAHHRWRYRIHGLSPGRCPPGRIGDHQRRLRPSQDELLTSGSARNLAQVDGFKLYGLRSRGVRHTTKCRIARRDCTD
jgi:hypothetical protein